MMPVHVIPQEFMDVIRLFSKLSEEHLEYSTDLLAARKDAFLQRVATIRDSNLLKQDLS